LRVDIGFEKGDWERDAKEIKTARLSYNIRGL